MQKCAKSAVIALSRPLRCATVADAGCWTCTGPIPRRPLGMTLSKSFAMFGGRFTAVPERGFGLSGAGRDYSLGWRLTRERTGQFEFRLEGQRQECADRHAGPVHEIWLRLTARW